MLSEKHCSRMNLNVYVAFMFGVTKGFLFIFVSLWSNCGFCLLGSGIDFISWNCDVHFWHAKHSSSCTSITQNRNLPVKQNLLVIIFGIEKIGIIVEDLASLSLRPSISHHHASKNWGAFLFWDGVSLCH